MERISGAIEVPGDEVDLADWFSLSEAARKLTYAQDRKLLRLV
jgi:predicted NUDIX family NTP pyrophosphohydrolase